MEEDVSRTMIFALVILTLAISVLGMWTVISQVNAPLVPPSQQQGAPSAHGRLVFTIENPSAPAISAATGRVALEIVPEK